MVDRQKSGETVDTVKLSSCLLQWSNLSIPNGWLLAVCPCWERLAATLFLFDVFFQCAR